MGKRKSSKVRIDIDRHKGFNNEEKIHKYQLTKNLEIRNEIVTENIPLVLSIIKTFALNDKSYYADLIADAYLLLVEAIDGYDGESAKFSTYLTKSLQNRISDMIAKYEGGNCSVHYGRMVARYHYLASAMFGKDAMYEEENMDYILKIMLEEGSTNTSAIITIKIIIHCMSKNGTDEIKNVIDEDYDVEREEQIDFIRDHYDELFVGLTDYEQELIKYMYGFIDGVKHKAAEAAKRYGYSRQSIQAQEKRALGKMYTRVNKYR